MKSIAQSEKNLHKVTTRNCAKPKIAKCLKSKFAKGFYGKWN